MADHRPLTIQSGVATRLAAADAVEVGTGVVTSSGDLNLRAAGSNVAVQSGKNLTMAGAAALTTGTGTVTVNGATVFAAVAVTASGASSFDLSGGSGVFKTPTGALTVGPGALTVSASSSTFTNGVSLSSTLAVTGTADIAAIDRSGTITIGGTNATTITIGRSGQTVAVAGDLTVAGTEIVTGATTFQSSATFEGNVTFGNAATDTVTFTSRLATNFFMLKETGHAFAVDKSTTVSTSGGYLALNSGGGSDAVGATAGAAAGLLIIAPGNGGEGTATGSAGAGGSLAIDGGAAGTDNGGGGANGGDIDINAGAASGSGTNGTIDIGTSNTSAIGIGASGVTTTITGGLTQLTGAISMTGNAASSIITSSGALTITSAAAATWSTGLGALTLNGTGGINLQFGASTKLTITTAGAQVQAGAVLSTTGSGNINLPQNASARFQIEGTATTSGVTATNLNTLTDGSNADALHVHAAAAATQVSVSGTSGEAINIGEVVTVDNVAGSPRYFKSDANGAGELVNVTGISGTTVAGAGNAMTIYTAGERSIADAEFDSVPAVGDVGKWVYLSTTSGNLTLTAPSTAGETVIRVGQVSQGGAGAVKVVILIGDGFVV